MPARDARWSLELANAIVLSTHTGQAVPLPVDRDGIRGSARGPALRDGDNATTRIAVSNLAAPEWTLERMLEAVREYGYDGLELRLLGGEPIDVLSLAAGTRRAVGTTLARAAIPLVCLDTSIELAQSFDRELPAAVELACEWGAPVVRVFGGTTPALDDIARRLEPVLGRAEELGVTIALETHDSFASAVLVGELLQRVESPSFAALWDVGHPYRVGEPPGDVLRALGERIQLVHVKDARRRTGSGSSSGSAKGRFRCARASPLSARPDTTAG